MSEHVESSISGPNNRPDPELAELPSPRRPFRRLTLLCLTLTAAGSLAFIWSLAGDVRYSISSVEPKDLGPLAKVTPNAAQANLWVRGEGELAALGGIRYERPLDSDSYRLAPLSQNPKLWVQIRVPAGYENEYFVAPTVFAGRLVPFSSLGLRYDALGKAAEDAGWQQGHVPKDAWLLIDGETPKSNRWIMGLIAMFAAYCAFSLWALVALLKPLPKPKLISGN
jgi:hypothetical protein